MNELLSDEINVEEMIYEIRGKLVILDSDLSKIYKCKNGTIYKLGYDGNLAEDGYEKGFLILTKGSSIKKHRHLNDIEKYVLLSGILSVDGKQSSNNICLLDNEHNIDTVTETTIIKTLKISKNMLYDKFKTYNTFIKIKK